MARGINKAIIVGHLGQDPEVRYLPSGGAVTNISVATTDSWKDKQSGELQERTEWHRIVFFNRLAEIAGEYLKKGAQVYIEGRLQTRKWQAQDGADRYSTEIIANEMQMLGGRQGAGMNSSDYDQSYASSAPPSTSASPSHAGQSAVRNTAQANAPAMDASAMDSFDDDIPF